MALQERVQMIDAIERSQEDQMAVVEGWLMGMLAVDPFDPVYDAFRSYTTLGLDVASLVSGGYGLVKGVAGFSQLARVPGQASRFVKTEEFIAKNIGKSNSIWTSTKKHNSVKNSFKHWKDHGREFSILQNSKQYVEATRNFVKNPPPGTLMKVRANGDILFYDPSLNTFAIINKDGIPRTMYKPNVNKHPYPTNMDYFNAQQ
jgi:hypothetical protein